MQTAHDPAPRRPLGRGERLGAVLFGGLLVALMAGELASGGDPRKLSVLFMLMSWYPLLLIHELGHALVARLLGWRVHEIVLGFGPELLRLSALGGARVTVRLIPAGGYVVPSPRDLHRARPKSAMIYLAGPLAELMVPLCLWAWLGQALLTPTDDLTMLAAQSLSVAAIMGAVMNLIPTTAAGSASDGLGVILSLGTPDDHFTYQMARPQMTEAQRRIDAGEPRAGLGLCEAALARDPTSPYLACMRARCLAACGRVPEAMAELEALREQPQWSDLVEGERLHAAACVALAAEDRSLRFEGEQACKAALERMPGAPEVLLTHGALLLEQGRHAEANAQLQRAYKQSREPAVEDRCLALLARAAEGLGKADDARLFREALARRTPQR